MCLYSLTTKNPKKLPKSRVCWKLFTLNRSHKKGKRSWISGWCYDLDFRYRPGTYRIVKWMRDNRWGLSVECSRNDRYPYGYHAFESRCEAEARRGLNGVIRKVKLIDIVAKGKQDKATVYVARAMRIFPLKKSR